jgi:hypothetical protein
MYLSILILPLLGSIVSGFFGRKIGVTGSQIITCTCLIFSSILITVAFYEVCLSNSPVYIYLGSWLDSELITISWEFYFDQLTVSLGLAVLYCSTLIHIFSVSYLSSDPAMHFGKALLWVLLSNSGDTLKLIIPNYNWKFISGWTNHSGKVTSYKMSENEMGYRGSKSVFLSNTVKEQRVDGSRCEIIAHLRYTLMGFERNYQVKIPSKQLNVRKLSTASLNYNYPTKVNPWFWSGFIDGEGSFSIIIDKNKYRKLGWRVQSKFQIGVHKRDLSLLLQLQQFLGGIGSMYIHPFQNIVNYSIDSNKDLTNLIDHLDKYPLLTQKSADFILFKQVVELMNNKDHLSVEGLHKLINMKASMNLGLSDLLKSEFNKFTPVERPIINTESIPDSNWIAGFVTAEGNFDVNIPQSTTKIGHRVQLRFRITQHERDIKLMECIIKFLGSGNIYKYPKNSAVSITIVKYSDITNTIIPFFKKNPLFGVKLFDFLDWCKIAELMSDGSHLTVEGLNLIRTIKSEMNTGRKYY